MFKTYFGEWGTGKLQRLPYLGYHVLLMVIIFAIIFGSIMAVGTTENLMGGNIAEIQATLLDTFGVITLLGIVSLLFIMFLAQINLLGKRIRDMGLPALWTLLGLIAVSIVLNIVFSPEEVAMHASAIHTSNISTMEVSASATSTNIVIQIFDMIVFLCLIFIPSNTFGNKNHY